MLFKAYTYCQTRLNGYTPEKSKDELPKGPVKDFIEDFEEAFLQNISCQGTVKQYYTKVMARNRLKLKFWMEKAEWLKSKHDLLELVVMALCDIDDEFRKEQEEKKAKEKKEAEEKKKKDEEKKRKKAEEKKKENK